ncbi:hypothetical protein ACFLZZ_04195 [Nanoarchaeota archaeon]
MTRENIEEAKRLLRIADHMCYITYPVLKEKRLLIKILEQINLALRKTISSIIEHEYLQKRIKKFDDPKLNFDTFIECCPKYGIESSQINIIKKVAYIMDLHNKSPLEFVRKDAFIIMTDNLQTEQITLERVKIFLQASKKVLENTELRFVKERGL